MIVLDTIVVSEFMRPVPEPAVVDWLRRQESDTIAVTAISVGEILRGICRLPTGKRRDTLAAGFANFMAVTLVGHTVPFDDNAAHAFGPLAAEKVMSGVNTDTVDIMIAAIALSRNAAVATRNTRDFEGCGITVINPWFAD